MVEILYKTDTSVQLVAYHRRYSLIVVEALLLIPVYISSEPFNCVQTNEQCWIELLMLNSNT